MSAFATLASVYNTPVAMHGDVDQTDSNINARSRALNQFLAGVELKAFKIAQSALRHEHDALDAVQDAMLQLTRAYSDRPAEEWRPLFYRILENRIRDMQRRRTVRGRIMAWLPAHRDEDDEEAADPISQAPSDEITPARRMELDEAMSALERALQDLPNRQRQAFLLRNLEGLDVAAVATAMGCSEGSVKTHHFRALKALRARLGEFST
jgi:RNA polymerase sigma-70 factor (ECF subfamily)